MLFQIDSKVEELGVKAVGAEIHIDSNRDNSKFDLYKSGLLEVIREDIKIRPYKEDEILGGFRELHTKVGRSNRDYIASPEMLYRQFQERNKFPHINTLVDIYNLMSLKTRLALGAHDISHIEGNVTLKFTTGKESFLPLGSRTSVKVLPNEYGYIDDKDNLICRLEVLQVEPTKITKDTRDIFLIIEGNKTTSEFYVREVALKTCEMIKMYCGGSYKLLN
jgi:DNA/RNA-binding domain of Phe-tRNA-synthetase-like protein